MAKVETKPREYVVVDNPFYDGVQLHPVGKHVIWAGPPSNSLVPVEESAKRRSTTEAPIFGDPLGGPRRRRPGQGRRSTLTRRPGAVTSNGAGALRRAAPTSVEGCKR